MTIASCPVCSSTAAFSFTSKYARVAECSNQACQHLFAMARPPGSGVQQVSNPENKRAIYRERNARLMARLRDLQVIKPECHVLDVGSGTGHVALALRGQGQCRVTCVEADPVATKFLREQGFEAVSELTGVSAKFDAITFIEVIEHLDDPVTVLQQLASVLKPTGNLLVTTPSGKTRIGHRSTNAYETPEHVQFFTKKSLSLALTKAGFARPKFITINELYPNSSRARTAVRHLRNLILGTHHLVSIVGLGR
jgi:2-polyprenyl-3-methyl-5-hydroxy-6-metoxy-1,4-benzoquinol methylase